MKLIKLILLSLLGIIKSFFGAVTQVAWGLTGIIGLGIGLTYMFEKHGIESININPLFLQMQIFILENIMLFVGAIFILYLYFEIKELRK